MFQKIRAAKFDHFQPIKPLGFRLAEPSNLLPKLLMQVACKFFEQVRRAKSSQQLIGPCGRDCQFRLVGRIVLML